MKKHGLDEDIDYNKKDEIEKDYEDFEKGIKDDYFKSSLLNLLNPFNYFDFENYSEAYSKDENSCFFVKYENGMKEIENIKND